METLVDCGDDVHYACDMAEINTIRQRIGAAVTSGYRCTCFNYAFDRVTAQPVSVLTLMDSA